MGFLSTLFWSPTWAGKVYLQWQLRYTIYIDCYSLDIAWKSVWWAMHRMPNTNFLSSNYVVLDRSWHGNTGLSDVRADGVNDRTHVRESYTPPFRLWRWNTYQLQCRSLQQSQMAFIMDLSPYPIRHFEAATEVDSKAADGAESVESFVWEWSIHQSSKIIFRLHWRRSSFISPCGTIPSLMSCIRPLGFGICVTAGCGNGGTSLTCCL